MGKTLRIVGAASLLLFSLSSLLMLDKINQLFSDTGNDHHLESLEKQQYNTFDSLAVATRVYFQQNSQMNDVISKRFANKMALLCNQVVKYSNLLLIAIDGKHENKIKQMFGSVINKYNSLEVHTHFKIDYIIISPWIGYTTALNAIIRYISIYYKQIKHVSFQSLEITQLSPKIINILMNQYMDNHTLVVGPKISDVQITEITEITNDNIDSNSVEINITGLNIPWNTLNIWNLNKLKLFGFSLISDGISQDIKGGIEEVITISLIQHINEVKTNKCKLIIFQSAANNLINWDTQYIYSENRRNSHQSKLQSKIQRAKQQLAVFKNLPIGKCLHITHFI